MDKKQLLIFVKILWILPFIMGLSMILMWESSIAYVGPFYASFATPLFLAGWVWQLAGIILFFTKKYFDLSFWLLAAFLVVVTAMFHTKLNYAQFIQITANLALLGGLIAIYHFHKSLYKTY